MFLTEVSNFPSLFDPFKKNKKDVAKKFDLISHSFDESVLRRLKALTNSRPSSDPINFSWLSSAVDFLSFTHNEAITLISSLKLEESLSVYLNDSVKLLDLCNSITAEIERLRHRRLVISFALHVLNNNSGDLEKLKRARVSLSDWETSAKRSRFDSDLKGLVRDLAPGLKEVPRGKISSGERIARRTIYAVGLVTVFVADAVVAALRGSTEFSVSVRAPAEFLWADLFNSLTVREEEGGNCFLLLKELEDVERRIREVSDVIGDVSGENVKELNGAVRELETATEALGEGLERLSNGVNEVFNTVLNSRKGMLEKMSGSNQQKQQHPK